MHPKSPVNNILVTIDKKYQDEIVTPSGLKLFKDLIENPEWNVTVTGKVKSVPFRLESATADDGTICLGESRHLIDPVVKKGDELFFAYDVVEDKEVIKDSDTFVESTESKTINKVWSNGKQEQLKFQVHSHRLAAAVYIDEYGDLKDGHTGTPNECEKWLSQFSFTGEDIIFKNRLWTDRGDYWLVDYSKAIAVKRKDKIIMIGGNVMCEEQKEQHKLELNAAGILVNAPKINVGTLKVIAVGKPLKGEPDLGIKAGDLIKVMQKHVQKYELWGQKVTLINQKSILGKL